MVWPVVSFIRWYLKPRVAFSIREPEQSILSALQKFMRSIKARFSKICFICGLSDPLAVFGEAPVCFIHGF